MRRKAEKANGVPPPPEDEESPPEVCALCGREEELTAHHLIPKARHNKPRMQRRHSRREMRERLLMICRPCHDNVHRSLTEQELGETYNTLEALRAHPDVAKFSAWIAKRPVGWKPSW